MICQFCGVEAPTKKVSFHQNIGMLVMRTFKSASGRMCKNCIHKNFWTMELTNLTLGWWGVISFITNVFIIPWNLIQYLICLPLESVPVGAQVPQLTDSAVQQLEPYTQDLIDQLNSGEQFERVSENIGMKAGVSPGTVAIYVQALAAASQQGH